MYANLHLRRALTRALLAGALMTAAFAASAAAKPTHIDQGKVQGVVEDGLTVYRGRPFAAPPIGDLRWRAPEQAAHWSGVRMADKFAPACIGNGPGSSEDCLYLNVVDLGEDWERTPAGHGVDLWRRLFVRLNFDAAL